MKKHSRTYPAYPIPAVGAFILNDNHIVLVQRGQAPAKGKWTIPGGAIEVGESPEEALVREVHEECQLDITVQRVVTVINKVVYDCQGQIEYHYVILDYLATCQEGKTRQELSLVPGSDALDVRWIALHALASYDLTEGLFDMIQNAVVMHNHAICSSER